MLTLATVRPQGMTAFASRVFDVLTEYTVSPWNVLKVECGWRGVDPITLEPRQLEELVPCLGAHVARMTDATNGAELECDLNRLLALHALCSPRSS